MGAVDRMYLVSAGEKRSVGKDNAGAHATGVREHAAEDNKTKGRGGCEAGLRNSDQEMPTGGDAGGRLGYGIANR